jgi:hypothetical protein
MFMMLLGIQNALLSVYQYQFLAAVTRAMEMVDITMRWLL